MQQAESQGYRPQYLTTIAGAAVQDNAPRSAVKNLHGFGWMPSVDVDPSQQPYAQTPAQKACLAKLAAARPAARGLQRLHGRLPGLRRPGALREGARPADLDGRGSVVAGRRGRSRPSTAPAPTTACAPRRTQRGGPATMREYAWTHACSCLTYRGRPSPSRPPEPRRAAAPTGPRPSA